MFKSCSRKAFGVEAVFVTMQTNTVEGICEKYTSLYSYMMFVKGT